MDEDGNTINEVVDKLGKPDDRNRTDMIVTSLEESIYDDFLEDGVIAIITFLNGKVRLKHEDNVDYRKDKMI